MLFYRTAITEKSYFRVWQSHLGDWWTFEWHILSPLIHSFQRQRCRLRRQRRIGESKGWWCGGQEGRKNPPLEEEHEIATKLLATSSVGWMDFSTAGARCLSRIVNKDQQRLQGLTSRIDSKELTSRLDLKILRRSISAGCLSLGRREASGGGVGRCRGK